MNKDKFIREDGRFSFWPEELKTVAGDYCFVAYKDGDCDCIEDARLLHFNQGGEIGCETKMVNGHSSYHFELAWKEDGKVSYSLSIL